MVVKESPSRSPWAMAGGGAALAPAERSQAPRAPAVSTPGAAPDYTVLMDITSSHADSFEQIARRHRVELLLQYGSTLGGRTHASSDIDLAVLFEGQPTLERQMGLVAELQEALRGSKVDLGLLHHADPLFLRKVLENCRLLAGSPRRLAELRLYAFRRYQDHRRFLALEDRHVRRFVAERLGT